jgi:hypothetical protein
MKRAGVFMNFLLKKIAAVFTLGVMCLLSLPAQAQVSPVGQVPQGQNIRRFPDVAQRADFTVKLFPELVVNGKAERLAPGGRIFNEQNLIVTPASMTGQKLVVNYTKDSYGLVKDVWILTPEERKLKAPNVIKRDTDKALSQQIQQQ